jgi:hypothetical protein
LLPVLVSILQGLRGLSGTGPAPVFRAARGIPRLCGEGTGLAVALSERRNTGLEICDYAQNDEA